jgi:hypothetical protein
MSGFTFRMLNNRGDLSELNLMLTADSSTGLEGIQLGKSTPLSEFFASNPSQSFTAETLRSSRLYVGYGELPLAPDPNNE